MRPMLSGSSRPSNSALGRLASASMMPAASRRVDASVTDSSSVLASAWRNSSIVASTSAGLREGAAGRSGAVRAWGVPLSRAA
ncbi:MAG: hypothetical protein M5U35_04270 [Roseovarius sp.]|nr:hypothetical protein [Roseovarius sp.]